MRRFQGIAAVAIVAAAAVAFASAQGASRGVSVVRGSDSIKGTAGNAGKRYAICIGVNNYEDAEIKDLEKARNDAVGLGAALKAGGQFDAVFVMTDDVDPRFDAQRAYPRLANIRGRLAYLRDFIRPEDLVVVTFSGHGVADDTGASYLLAADSRNSDPYETGLPVQEIVDWLAGLRVRKALLAIDACRVSVTTRASRGAAPASIRAEQYEKAEVAAVFFATKTGWFSFEDLETEYGIFTRFLIEGLGGKADYQYGNRDGIVTFRELGGFVEDAVSSYALGLGLKQRPYTRVLGEAYGDLALASYSASVDVASRSVPAPEGTVRGGYGSARVFSNVAGRLLVDGAPYASLERGRRLTVDDLPAGPHFIEIDHEFGSFKKEVAISDGQRSDVVNLVVLGDRPPRVAAGTAFAYVPGDASTPGFWLGESEVSFGQFAEFVGRSGYVAKGAWARYYQPAFEMYPVIHVTWEDCVAYAAWLSKKSGLRVGLPSSAQRELAAAGRPGDAYPWGADWEPEFCHGADSAAQGALPVVGRSGPVQEQFPGMDVTIGGLSHMAGNVREWCSDRKASSDGAELAAVGGGSWRLSRPKYFAAGYSSFARITSSEDDLGFRVALLGD
ncbi:MAG: SUMF1/EgtB/PvdO family nonheme iron enzyme [Spirochaetes bacterium]|nr:SUMF1/EgtB/PvdO family nonheme iron enzyme [Spirochaetota bacterium]MBU1078893.1 SUMF1/EgtB/PvdO family nonheme iron enzyme [Spirochaetota bacterium]